MHILVQVEPPVGAAPEVDYRWDADTEILSAHVRQAREGSGMSGSVGVEGTDGSWLILDLEGGRINAVEVAVWPEVRRLSSLVPPGTIEEGMVVVPSRRSRPDVATLEAVTTLVADADASRRTIHFRLGKPRETRTVRYARDILLDIDPQNRLAGLWLLNVPPCPP